MKIKDFINFGDKLFISENYGKDILSNEEYDLIVEDWERLRKFLEIQSKERKK